MALCRKLFVSFHIFRATRCLPVQWSNNSSYGSLSSFLTHKPEDTEPPVAPSEHVHVENRKHKSGRDRIPMAENLNLLQTHGRLDTKKEYKAPPDVEVRIQEITLALADVSSDTPWYQVSLSDPHFKYQLLTRFMKAFDHSIPNTVLTNMHTVRDAVDFFQEDVILTNRLEDLTKLDLPKNLHIKLEYQRFDPETDTMFGGKNPLPGSNAIVNSIKYRRKYKSIITKEDKPGYINHYYGY